MLDFKTVRRRFPEVRVTQGKSGIEYNCHCPKEHRKGGIYKLYINAEEEVAYCADCGWSANARLEFFPMEHVLFRGLHIEREREEMQQIYLPTIARNSGPTMENNVPLPGKLVKLAGLPDDHPAWQYLSSRGFDCSEIRDFDPARELFYVEGLTAHGAGDKRTVGRLLFPIRSNGQLSGWQARKIERQVDENRKEVWNGKAWKTVLRRPDGEWADKGMKYITSPGISVGQTLFNLDSARACASLHGGSYTILCEGPLDVIRVGIRAVGSFGAPTVTQKKIIDANFDFVIILLDPDINPRDNPGKFASYTSGWGVPRIWLHLPGGKDPGATERSVIAYAIESALKQSNGIPINHPTENFKYI